MLNILDLHGHVAIPELEACPNERVLLSRVRMNGLVFCILLCRKEMKHTFSPLNAMEGTPLLEYWNAEHTWVKMGLAIKKSFLLIQNN